MPWQASSLCFIVIQLASMLGKSVSSSTPFVQVSTNELKPLVFTSADGYKSLALENDVLYVGGRNKLFRLNPENVSKTLHRDVNWKPSSSDRSGCLALPRGNHETCNNYIQTIQSYNTSHMLLCGTMALSPTNKFLDLQYGSLHESDVLRTPLCSHDPKDSTTSVLGQKKGTFSGIAGTSRTQSQYQMLIIKNLEDGQALRSSVGNGKMIDEKAEFIYSFAAADIVDGHTVEKLYFVFGETTVEPDVNSHKYGARIAQVCANDQGTNHAHRWTSFLKLSLLCQTDEKAPYPFSVITDSYFSEDSEILYGTFRTQSLQFRNSAVCAFRLRDIQRAFHSRRFWNVNGDGDYEEISGSEVPRNPSPGDCAYPDMPGSSDGTSKGFSANFVSFMTDHPLVANPANPIFPPNPLSKRSGPLLSNDRETFVAITQQTVTDINGMKYNVLFVGTDNGKIIKFVPLLKNDGIKENIVLAELQVADEAISGLLESDSNNQLYIQTNSKILQVPTGSCQVYTSSCQFCDPCRMCVLARDPMCAWNNITQRCEDDRSSNLSASLVQDVMSGNTAMCGNIEPVSHTEKSPQFGYSSIIGKAIKCPSISVKWSKQQVGQGRYTIDSSSTKYRVTSEKRLEISSFAEDDIATFTAEYKVGGTPVAIQSVTFSSTVISKTPDSTVIVPKDSSDKVTSRTAGKPQKTTNSSDGSPTDDGNTPALVASSISLVTVVIVVVVIALVIFVCLYLYCICKRKRLSCCKHEEVSKTKKDEKSGNGDIHMYRSGDIPTKHQNNSSNKVPVLWRSSDDLVDGLSKEEAAPFLDQNSFVRKKVAKVLPIGQNQDQIDYTNETATIPVTDENRERKAPLRTKSIPSQNISVTLDRNRVVKSNSVYRHKVRGTWFIEIFAPDDYEFKSPEDLKRLELSNLSGGQLERIGDGSTPEENFQETDPFPVSPPSKSVHNPVGKLDLSSNSDSSTIKASDTKNGRGDSPFSSLSSTPRPFIKPHSSPANPLLPSSYHNKLRGQNGTHSPRCSMTPSSGSAAVQSSLPVSKRPHVQTDPDMSTHMRRESTRSDTSPTSTTSSTSSTSEKFHTAPPSPVRTVAG